VTWVSPLRMWEVTVGLTLRMRSDCGSNFYDGKAAVGLTLRMGSGFGSSLMIGMWLWVWLWRWEVDLIKPLMIGKATVWTTLLRSPGLFLTCLACALHEGWLFTVDNMPPYFPDTFVRVRCWMLISRAFDRILWSYKGVFSQRYNSDI
jgi:hypothetical protein